MELGTGDYPHLENAMDFQTLIELSNKSRTTICKKSLIPISNFTNRSPTTLNSPNNYLIGCLIAIAKRKHKGKALTFAAAVRYADMPVNALLLPSTNIMTTRLWKTPLYLWINRQIWG